VFGVIANVYSMIGKAKGDARPRSFYEGKRQVFAQLTMLRLSRIESSFRKISLRSMAAG
jgi:hypothetical protein